MDFHRQIALLFKEIDQLKNRIVVLEAENTALKIENQQLRQENQQLRQENHQLRREITVLKDMLSKGQQPKKNSRNSSIPPSKDENRPLKTKSLRQPTDNKPGGQLGREGTTLKMTEHPDQIIDHIPEYCTSCGSGLEAVPVDFAGKRQVIDIPVVKPQYIEHRIYQKQCSCGHSTCSSYPDNVNAPISYGAGAESIVGYLHSRQYMPFERIREFLNTAFHLPISEGGIHELLNRLVSKAAPAYQIIKDRITNSKVVGADETGAKINGKKCWIWTWQNDKLTFIIPSENRGYATIADTFENGFQKAVLIHDCWRSHFLTDTFSHQLCTAHLIRELNYFIEKYSSDWAVAFRKLLWDAQKVKQKMNLECYHKKHPPKDLILERFHDLLEQRVNEKQRDLVAFHKRMVKYSDYVFNFLNFPDVPPDNNGSERAIRNVKVKQKISGQFKSFNGAMSFSILRSITDTAIKNGQNILAALFTIAGMKVVTD